MSVISKQRCIGDIFISISLHSCYLKTQYDWLYVKHFLIFILNKKNRKSLSWVFHNILYALHFREVFNYLWTNYRIDEEKISKNLIMFFISSCSVLEREKQWSPVYFFNSSKIKKRYEKVARSYIYFHYIIYPRII